MTDTNQPGASAPQPQGHTISTMQVSQPALAAAAAWLLLGESVRPVQFIGMGVVIGSLVLYSLTVQRAAFPWERSRR